MRDCPSGDFYVVELNGLTLKKCDASQEKPKISDRAATDKGRAKSSRHDPPPKHSLPEWGSTKSEKKCS